MEHVYKPRTLASYKSTLFSGKGEGEISLEKSSISFVSVLNVNLCPKESCPASWFLHATRLELNADRVSQPVSREPLYLGTFGLDKKK